MTSVCMPLWNSTSLVPRIRRRDHRRCHITVIAAQTFRQSSPRPHGVCVWIALSGLHRSSDSHPVCCAILENIFLEYLLVNFFHENTWKIPKIRLNNLSTILFSLFSRSNIWYVRQPRIRHDARRKAGHTQERSRHGRHCKHRA